MTTITELRGNVAECTAPGPRAIEHTIIQGLIAGRRLNPPGGALITARAVSQGLAARVVSILAATLAATIGLFVLGSTAPELLWALLAAATVTAISIDK